MSAANLISVEVPDIGDFTDVPVIEILVGGGDSVGVDDPLLTLESDKATMDVPSPLAGTVRELRVSVGDRVSQGTVLLTLEPSGEADAEVGSKAAAVASEGVPVEAAAPGAVESALQAEEGSAQPAVPPAPRADAGAPVYASPSVRRAARERGVDLSSVTGSGRKGRITRADLEVGRATPATGPVPGTSPGATLPGLAPWPSLDFSKQGPVERVPRTRIQRISAPNLARNWAMIPHVTHHDEADITGLESWRRELNAEQGGKPEQAVKAEQAVKVTMVSFLVLASVATLKAFPEFNSSLDGDQLIVKHYYNIGFAADTPGGLVVPVIKGADEKGLLDIARELTVLSGRAREGKLGPAEMSGSTFTISSLGGIGGTGFTPIVNAPEVAILGATRSAMKPVWNGQEFVPRLMLPLSLSYDHRVIDGAAAARFMVHLVGVLSDLRRVLL
jgi:pyruvate dehydrogenase E2 component (dihydrolipoamide acetyltransferase)